MPYKGGIRFARAYLRTPLAAHHTHVFDKFDYDF